MDIVNALSKLTALSYDAKSIEALADIVMEQNDPRLSNAIASLAREIVSISCELSEALDK